MSLIKYKISGVLFLLLFFFGTFYLYSNRNPEIQKFDYSSEATELPYGKIDSLKRLFDQEVGLKFKKEELLTSEKLQDLIQKNINSKNHSDDLIDDFLSQLPENYRRHFSLVHRSFSIQQATPQSPRVILYGPDAKIMLTFNAGKDTNGKELVGGNSIEIIEWNTAQKTWDFSELKAENNTFKYEKNPGKCVACHAGTPKPADFSQAQLYKGFLKPIFPQYPFWPGFYGSVNDIVASHDVGSKDTVMKNFPDTLKQIQGLTFASTEELFRLNRLLNDEKTKPLYVNLIKQEQDIHQKYFMPFINSIKNRERYKHLITLKDLYVSKNLPIPEFLKTAPYRRTFDKEYGHYLFRPNFYLSSLMTFYHAQYVAEQIKKTSFFNDIKYTFLARKYNCGQLSASGITLNDLDPSFDLLYPNLTSSQTRDKQYLLAYQYNVARPHNKTSEQIKPLPLHAWNLEGNEDIASYHYGNVYSDLNELVLRNLFDAVFPDQKLNKRRNAAENRHYELGQSKYFEQFLADTGGFVARMSDTQYKFASQLSPYIGQSEVNFAAQPVSNMCDEFIVPAAKDEMSQLALKKQSRRLPHDDYKLDQRLYDYSDIVDGQKKYNLNLVKQACESCHVDNLQRIKPQINVDWFSEQYHADVNKSILRFNDPENKSVQLKQAITEVLSPEILPVPFGKGMPYGRRPMEDFSLKCEKMIIESLAADSQRAGSMAKIFNCTKEEMNSKSTKIECQCRRLSERKDMLHKEFYGIK